MKNNPDEDNLIAELAAVRGLIDGHDNMQALLDLAADEADRRAVENERSRRLAWRVTAAFGGLALIASGITWAAVATAMWPAPQPGVLVVEKASGVVQPLISLAEFQIAPEEATIRRNIDTYVTACEGYSYEQADIHYYTCAAFMSPQLQGQWAQKWDKSNPDSPPNRYKKDRRVRVKVGAIAVLRNGLGAAIGGRASFTRSQYVGDAEDGPSTTWVANLSFHWVNQPTNERDRRINDLGMEVTDYTSDRDLTPAKSAPANPARQVSQQQPASPIALVAPTSVPQVTP
jgi:type IV secretion system protein VirB8